MRQFLYILLIVFTTFSSRAMAQSLIDCTISTCSIQTEVLTATVGEVVVSGGGQDLLPGFIEILLVEANNIPEEPEDPEDPEEPGEPEEPVEPEEPEDPTAIESVEDLLGVVVKGNSLQIHCNRPYELAVYNLSGNLVVRKKVWTDIVSVLPSGVYVVVLWNQEKRNVYKINIRQ